MSVFGFIKKHWLLSAILGAGLALTGVGLALDSAVLGFAGASATIGALIPSWSDSGPHRPVSPSDGATGNARWIDARIDPPPSNDPEAPTTLTDRAGKKYAVSSHKDICVTDALSNYPPGEWVHVEITGPDSDVQIVAAEFQNVSKDPLPVTNGRQGGEKVTAIAPGEKFVMTVDDCGTAHYGIGATVNGKKGWTQFDTWGQVAPVTPSPTRGLTGALSSH